MKTICPGRNMPISGGCGSFTLTIMSAASKTSLAPRDDRRAGLLVILVGEPAADAGLGLDEHLVARLDQHLGPDGHHARRGIRPT